VAVRFNKSTAQNRHFGNPHALPPQLHMWDSERLRWFELADRLPRHPDAALPPSAGGD
jgi:hypothetical protein